MGGLGSRATVPESHGKAPRLVEARAHERFRSDAGSFGMTRCPMAPCRDRLLVVTEPFGPIAPPSQRAVGPYQLEAEIARGGFGVVYRARHASTGRPAAVKVLHADLFHDFGSIARFEREAKVVLSLSHPGIVEILEHGQADDGRPFIAMELLSGESLESLLARARTLSADDTLDILLCLADALSAVHDKGVIHRDIKPSNVFVAEGRPKGRVVLLDFGIAKLLAAEGPALTTSRAAIGTIPFMSPEQVRGDAVDARSDVYSLAALTYMMLTGEPPFGTRLSHVLRQIHLHARPEAPSLRAPVRPELDIPILAALAREKEARPPSARAFVDSLCVALGSAGSELPEVPEGVSLRSALAVFVTLRPSSHSAPAGDLGVFDAQESALTIARSELVAAGLIAIVEKAQSLVAVSAQPPDSALAERVVAACERAHRRILERSRDLVTVGMAAHAGDLHLGEGGVLLPSGLLDAGSWASSGMRGVLVSGALLPYLNVSLEAAPSAPGFFFRRDARAT